MSSLRQRQSSVWVAALAASLCVLLQLVGPAHYLVVEHVRCAEHGEVVHSDDHADVQHGGEQAEASAAHVALSKTAAVAAADAQAHDDAHEHCPLACNERTRALSASAAVTPLRFTHVAERALDRVERVVARTPLDAAPKTSPPIAG